MFAFHGQIVFACDLVGEGRVSELRFYRVDFGFPRRPASAFRYVRTLGGGALLDCGGYALKLGAVLAGMGAPAMSASISPDPSSAVDLYGSVTVEGASAAAKVSWGMGNDYRCSLDVWGSAGTPPHGAHPDGSRRVRPGLHGPARRHGRVPRKRPADGSFA